MACPRAHELNVALSVMATNHMACVNKWVSFAPGVKKLKKTFGKGRSIRGKCGDLTTLLHIQYIHRISHSGYRIGPFASINLWQLASHFIKVSDPKTEKKKSSCLKLIFKHSNDLNGWEPSQPRSFDNNQTYCMNPLSTSLHKFLVWVKTKHYSHSHHPFPLKRFWLVHSHCD